MGNFKELIPLFLTSIFLLLGCEKTQNEIASEIEYTVVNDSKNRFNVQLPKHLTNQIHKKTSINHSIPSEYTHFLYSTNRSNPDFFVFATSMPLIDQEDESSVAEPIEIEEIMLITEAIQKKKKADAKIELHKINTTQFIYKLHIKNENAMTYENCIVSIIKDKEMLSFCTVGPETASNTAMANKIIDSFQLTEVNTNMNASQAQ